MSESNALTTTQPTQIERRSETFAPRSLSEAFAFADMVLVSGMAPKSYLSIYADAMKDGATAEAAGEKARSAVVVALQFGLEVGFQPMQALQCIANINGNPSVWGDGALALVQSSGLLESIREDDFEEIKKNSKATCSVKRRGDPEVRTVTFSYDDAKKAGIFERGVWKTYPYRMCAMRARAFALRDKFPDVLKGLAIAEEMQDIQPIEPMPEPPRIQATVVVPSLSTPSTGPEKAQVQENAVSGDAEAETVITREEAVAYFKAYSDSGWLKEESLVFLKTFDPPYESSLTIKRKDYVKAMDWAKSPRKKSEETKPPVEENLDAEPADDMFADDK